MVKLLYIHIIQCIYYYSDPQSINQHVNESLNNFVFIQVCEEKPPNTHRGAADPNSAPVVLVYTDEQKITMDPSYNVVIDNLLADLSVQVSDIKLQHHSAPKPLYTSKEHTNPNPSLIGARRKNNKIFQLFFLKQLD